MFGIQSIRCGIWWMWARGSGNLFIRNYNANVKLSRMWPSASLSIQHLLLTSVIVDPLQDLVITVSTRSSFFGIDAGQSYQVFLLEFRLASSQLPYPDSACAASLECKHTFDELGDYFVHLVHEPAICGDRIVILYYMRPTQSLFIQVIDWRKGHVNCVSPLYS